MSWIEKLYETYENNAASVGVVNGDQIPLWPLWHITQKAHINIVLDEHGNFKRASVIPKDDARTIIPASEKSAGRTTNDAPQPLCDKLQYVAGDYKKFGGKKDHYFESYQKQLDSWCNYPFTNNRIKAVFNYIKKQSVVNDLIECKVLITDSNNSLLSKWDGNKDDCPEIFKVNKDAEGQLGAFVRWSVEITGIPQSNLWSDREVWQSWIDFYSGMTAANSKCFVTGKECLIADQHPKKIRNDGDGAKLISSNDTSGYTFLGRFTDKTGGQTCSVGAEVSQKAHSALRWLIGRKQAFKNGDQAIVAWEVAGKEIPELFSNTFDLFADKIEEELQETYKGDSGQLFAQRLKRYIAGYSTKLGSTKNIIVLGLDSASPGRLSITYYRELTGSEFLTRIESWHSAFAWQQRINIDNPEKKNKQIVIYPICAPAPKDIALAAYGARLDDKLKKSTVERLLPCIIDGLPIPRDLVISAVRRASNRIGLEHWDWEKTLGVACALYKGYYLRNPNEKRSYSMALEPDRTSRDYLFGRLLAAADLLESVALHVTEKSRPTTAARLMQRFSDRPYSTWRNIELALSPYRARLHGHTKFDKTITEVMVLFKTEDFTSDKSLTGEFLLGYHCQREALKYHGEKEEAEKNIE